MSHLTRHADNTQTIGLDIGTYSVKGVETVTRGSDKIIRSATSVPIPKVECSCGIPKVQVAATAVKTLIASAGFKTNKAVLALPPEAVYTKWLHLESSNDEELDSIARATAARGAPFSSHDAMIDYRVISTRTVGSRRVSFVMLVAASSAAV